MIASALDSAFAWPRQASGWAADARLVDTAAGRLRVRDTGGRGPVIVTVPDGPNVIEHHDEAIRLLARHARVVCFDMPGFGFSAPRAGYRHTLEHGSSAILAVMDALGVREASLAFSCANGFYAIAAARRAPSRIRRLLLAQTPGLSAMPAWTRRNVPLPLRVPVVGQVMNRLVRHKLAHAWYGIAMPDRRERDRFRATAAQALDHGACFCLAGVVQGLSRAREETLLGAQQPVTLLWGDADRSHKHTRAESLLELLPQAQVRHLRDCGHFPDLERPGAYAELALASLA